MLDKWRIYVLKLDVKLSELPKSEICNIARAEHNGPFTKNELCVNHFRREDHIDVIGATFHKRAQGLAIRVFLKIRVFRS